MIKILFLCAVVSVPLFAQSESAFQISGSTNLSITSGDSADLEISVSLPKGNHLYVRPASALSMNQPTSFSTKSKGFRIEIKEEPSSQKKGDDFILEGKGKEVAGKYILSIFETLGRPASSKKQPLNLEITTQWCQTSTDKCLAPKTFTKKINVTIEGEKKLSAYTKARGGVSWVSAHADALSKAGSTGKNIFLIITAPTWCGYCKVLERDVFAKKNVADTLNDKFVPLQILDTSPDLRKFSFDGYPTMMVLSPKGQTLSTVNGRTENSFLAAIKKFEVEGNTPSPSPSPTTQESFKYSIKIEGTFSRQSNGAWAHTVGSDSAKLDEFRRDDDYVILHDKASNIYYALPSKGKTGYVFRGTKWEPMELE